MTPKHKITLTRTFDPESPNIAKLLVHHFGANPYFAKSRSVAGEITYVPIKQQLTEEAIQQHLAGQTTLGSYQLDKDSMVRWLGWDVDSTDREQAREYTEKIVRRLEGIPHAVEFSGCKGYHVLIFLAEPMSAAAAKQVTDFVRDAEGLPKTGKSHVECYPKQGSLDKTPGGMGSLLKIPLGLHPRTHDPSRFVDIHNGWENGKAVDPAGPLTQVASIEQLAALVKQTVDVRKQIVDLLVPHWVAAVGEHHNFALYLAGYLAHLSWGLQDTVYIIQEIALKAGDTDIHNRVQAVNDTFRSIEQGRNVKGFSGLNDMLPGGMLKTLSELAAQMVAPTLVKRIDAIRLQKGPAFEKVRSAAMAVWADLQENGEVVQTQQHQAYWFDAVNYLLVPFDSDVWQASLHRKYGINPADSFGAQISEELRLKAISSARIVTVQNRTVWDGSCLFVNLGGSEVYKLTGTDIETLHNGVCGYLFSTSSNASAIPIPDFSDVRDVWKELVCDISFLRSQDAPATPEEQQELLKAWMLSYFFPELLPTKPLLLALGVPGSGKTTAMRRILKILESSEEEVLEVVMDKPDSLRASLATHRLLVLDNLERSGAHWLVDTLNRLATGANIEIRQLYKTNETYVIRPKCFIAMTAVSMPFSEETLFTRMLPLEMQQLASPLPEHLLQQNLKDHTAGIWADILLKLNQVVATLNRDTTSMPPIASRLADFTVFCKRIQNSGVVKGSVLIKGLRSLVDRQKLALMESSPFISILEEWMMAASGDAAKPHSFAELFNVLEPLARSRKMTWRWSSATALGRHVMALAEPLKKLYRAEFSDDEDPVFHRVVTRVHFPMS